MFITLRHLIFALMVACVHMSVAHAIELGRGEVVMDAAAAAEYDSNITLSARQMRDLIGRTTAGLNFRQTNRSLLHLRSRVALELVRYSQHSEFNARNVYSEFELTYPNGVENYGSWELRADWSDVTRARSDAGLLLDSEQSGLESAYRLYISEKSGLRLEAALDQESFDDRTYPSSRDLSSDLDYVYRYSAKLDVTAGYRYRAVDYGRGITAQLASHRLGIGAEGKLSPKLNGSLMLGAEQTELRYLFRNAINLKPFHEFRLEWAATKKTKVVLRGLADFQPTPFGDINNRKDWGLETARWLTSRSSARLDFTIAEERFDGGSQRDDKSTAISIHYQHRFFHQSTLALHTRYETRESSFAAFNHDRVLLSLDFRVEY